MTPKHPLCSATLKDGSPCQSVAVEGDLCHGHAKRAAAAAEALEASPGPSAVSGGEAASAPEAIESDVSVGSPAPVAETSGSVASEGAEPVRIESLRAALREGASTTEVALLMKEMLLDGLRANKTIFSTCKKCGSRNPVELPDLGTRIASVRALTEELDGKQKAEVATADQKLEALRQRSEQDLGSCSDDELLLLIAAGNDGELPATKETARKLAEQLLADRNAGHPKDWLCDNLTQPERELLGRVSFESTNGWRGFSDRIYELAAEVVKGASAAQAGA